MLQLAEIVTSKESVHEISLCIKRQARAKTVKELAALPKVEEKLQEAEAQAQRYGAALRDRYGLTDLRQFAVVAIGLERVVWRALPPA